MQWPYIHWVYLAVAIIGEVTATSTLKATDNFTKLWPSLIVVAGYGVAFYFLTLTLKTIPIGITYAIWSGIGIVLVALIAWLYYGQTLDAPAMIGMLLIIAGVVVMNGFSESISH